MRRTTLFGTTLCVALLVGCSSNNQGKLDGTKWTSLETSLKDEKLQPGAILLEFTREGSLGSADGTFLYKVNGREYSGQYSLSRGNTVVFRFKENLAGRKVHTEQISVHGDTLTMTDTDGTKIPFKRLEEIENE